jgi:hypothetical protein
MSSVGAISTDIMRGLPQGLKERLEVWEVPGIQGYGALKLAKGDAAFELQTVKYAADNTAAQAYKVAAEAAQGTVVTVTDDWGTAYAGALIEHVEITKQPCIRNGSAQVRVEARWKMCLTQ